MKVPTLLALSGIRQLSSLSTTSNPSGVIGPAVRLLLLQYEIHGKDITPSGPKGNVLKDDVLRFIQAGNLKPASYAAKEERKPQPGQKYIDIPLTNMRCAIAKRLLASKQNIPHAYATVKVNANRLEALRKKFKKEGHSVSVNDFLIKAASSALKSVPEVNVQYVNGEIKSQKNIDISVAVATPSGLITPIVFNADRLGVAKISEVVRDLAKKAKDNKLQPAEFEGGSFTISNLGMFGSILNFTAIINPPQAAILAVGGTQKEYVEDGSLNSVFSVSLCFDSRAITELDSERFLEHFKLAIEDPDLILTGTDAFYDLSALL